MPMKVQNLLCIFLIFVLAATTVWSLKQNAELNESVALRTQIMGDQILTIRLFEIRRHAKMAKAALNDYPERREVLLSELNHTEYELFMLTVNDLRYVAGWRGADGNNPELDTAVDNNESCNIFLKTAYSLIAQGNASQKDITLIENGLNSIIEFTIEYPGTLHGVVEGLNEVNLECDKINSELRK